MATTASALPPLSSGGAGNVDQEDSNISSPLSEVDDKDDNDDDVVEHMHLDLLDRGQIKVADGPAKESNHTSDSDSVLSDAHSDVHSEGNDTEAETERLYDTPKHQRQRDVIVDQFNKGQIFESTPSKRRRTPTLDDHADDESLSGDEASVTSSHPGDESPSKPLAINAVIKVQQENDSQERKRKRSPGADPSENEQPLRKRTSSVMEHEPIVPQKDDDTVMREGEATPIHEASGTNTPLEDIDRSPQKHTALLEEDPMEHANRIIKKGRRGAKRKTAVAVDANHDVEGEDVVGLEAEHPAEGTDPDADEEIDAAAAHDEELERKHAAYKEWTQIEEMFGVFRDRLYKDRLQRLEEEEQSLLAEVPTHPEYLNMKQCLDDRLEQKLKEINKELEYRFQALDKRAVAQRAQIWGQYYQAVREKREKSLEALNKEWYDVQTARRNAHSLQDRGLLFPKDPAQRVRNAIAYNTEVSTLASIAKYEGFPAGPELKGASAVELNDDLAAIEQSRRARQRPAVQQREDFHTPGFSRLGPAGEQFLKETPWANPNHSAHKIFQRAPGTSDPRLENPAGKGTHPGFVPVPPDSKAPFESPNPNQRSPALSSRLSESPELARNMLNPAHQQAKRVGNLSGITANREPKATAT